MNYSVYDGIDAYARKANSELYIACKTSIFNNPADQIFTPKGKVTKVRQYSAGPAGNYDKRKGWMGSYGATADVRWIAYRAECDRAKILRVDAPDELASFANGMTPSSELLNSDFLNNHLPKEIDAFNIAKWYNQIPDDNKFVAGTAKNGVTLDISPDAILGSITMLDSLVFNAGYDRDTVLFMDSKAYANFITAIQNKNGLANTSFLTDRKIQVVVDTGIDQLIKGRDSVLRIDINVQQYGRFLIVRVPDDRMYSHIIMLSGDPEDVGQEQGGYIPDVVNPAFANIHMLAIPIEAAFTNVRYFVDNYLYPSYLERGITRVDLEVLNQRMFGNVEIANAGINQKANAYEIDVRCIFGGSLFDNRRKNCFALTGTVGGNTAVTSITLAVDGGGDATVNEGDTLAIQTTVEPDNATDKSVSYSVTNGTGEATVDSKGVVTGVKAGTVTVNASAMDGSSVRGDLAVLVKKN